MSVRGRTKKVKQIRIIASYPVLAKILSKHKPILISQEGWNYIVDWVAEIGTVMRSREYMVSVIVSLITQAMLSMMATALGLGGGSKE